MAPQQIRILIVDDDVLIAETLKDHLLKLDYRQIRMVHSKEEAFTVINVWNPHLALLDIRMEGNYDGLDIGQRLKDEFKIPFMYVTAHSDLLTTQKILSTRPDGYITKPIRINELMINLGMVVNRFLEENEESLTVKNGYDTEHFKLAELLFLKAEGNYVEIHLNTKKIVVRNSLETVINELNHTDVIRIHRSYAVNKQKIKRHSSSGVQLPEITLPVSRSYSAEVKMRL